MREILFRGKRIDNGEWVLGFLAFDGVNEDYYIYDREVDPSTVGQYTGLQDKNGKKIFEGDVLLAGGVQKVRVFFERGQFVVDHFAINVLCSRNCDSEVIGNIHDNPELLEVNHEN